MLSHDEYSSDEEELDEKSNVFLGFVDTPIDEEEEEPTIEDTFIGGSPVWLNGSQPKASQLKCGNCGKDMALLLQASAPLDGKLYERVIYIFGCKNSGSCSRKKGSIRAFRGISKDPETVAELKREQDEAIRKQLDDKLHLENKKKLHIELTKDLFGKKDTADANPFGALNPFSNPFDKPANPFAKEKEETKAEPKPTYAAVAKTAKPATSVKPAEKAGDLPTYSGFFLYVDQEKFKKQALDPELEKYKHLIDMDVDKEDSGSGSGSGSGRRGSTSSQASGPALDPQTAKISSMLDDKYFEQFSTKVTHNPGQVLRYDLDGKPLLYSGRDEVAKKFGGAGSVPNPGYNPSSLRRFELQLMPKAIIDLEQIDSKSTSINDILNGMSWGTIIVCTDKEDYVPEEELDDNHVAYIEEWCGVQWEDSV